MLKNKRIPFFLYDPDPAGGAPPAPTPTGGGGNKIEFTAEQQAHIDRLFSERAKRAEESALTNFLKTLGVENADALKAALDEGKKLKGAQMSELEKSNAALKDWETKNAALEVEAKKIPDLTKQVERMDAALKAQLETTRKDLPAHIIALLDKLDSVAQLEYVAANADALGKKPALIPGSPNPKGGGKPDATDDYLKKTYGTKAKES